MFCTALQNCADNTLSDLRLFHTKESAHNNLSSRHCPAGFRAVAMALPEKKRKVHAYVISSVGDHAPAVKDTCFLNTGENYA